MKNLFLAVLFLMSAIAGVAQSNQAFPQKEYYASDYGTWQVQGQTPNTYQFSPSSLCTIPQPAGGTFDAFNVNGPVYIQDAVTANSEVLTPHFVNINATLCNVALTTMHSHYSFALMSGTAGLQEALNTIAAQIPYATEVILDRNWYTAISGIPGQSASAVIASVKGNAAAILADVTQAPTQYYKWSGSAYVAVAPAGASIPATGGVLVTSGTPGQANATLALPANTTATTQTTGDSSTKLATGAFTQNTLAAPPSIGSITPNTGTFTGLHISGTNPLITSAPFSAAGTPLPTCSSANVNAQGIVSDATSPTSMGAYVSGGAITAPVVCSYNGTSYAWLTVGGASGATPVGSAGGALSGTYPNPGLAVGALPNGMTATTQSPGDNSTKVATTAYVAANGNLPSGTGLVEVTAGVGGTVSASFAGQAPIWTGSAWAADTVLQAYPGTVQYLQQPTSEADWTTFGVNNLNNVFYADGYVATGSYSGVGQAPVAWTNVTGNLGVGQVVTYGGNNYIAVQAGNGSTTPGTNIYYWMQVPNAQASTPLDIAWYSAEAWKHAFHHNALVVTGAGQYNTLGLVDYVDGSSFDDQFSVGLAGCGVNCSYITYTGTAATPLLNRPTGGGNDTSFLVHDVTLDGGATASAAIEVGSIGGSDFRNIAAGHVAAGADHVMEFGHAAGDAFQVAVNNVNIGIYPDRNAPNCAVITPTITGGSVTAYTVNTPGTCYSAASARNVYHVQVRGYGASGTSTLPCTVMPIGQTVTLSGSGIASISEGSNSGGSGCDPTAGDYYIQVYSTTPVNYGIVFNQSDSHDIHEVTSYLGDTASFIVGASNDSFHGLHPSVVPNGIISQLAADFVGTECDAVFDRCFTFDQPFSETAASIVGTSGYVGCGGVSRLLVGSSVYYLASASANINFGTSASLADGTHTGCLTGWQEFVTQSGPITSQATYLTKAPANFSVVGNDATAGETWGDYIPTLTVANLDVASCTGCTGSSALTPSSVAVQPLGTAISGTNYNAGANTSIASYWNGSAAANCVNGWTTTLNAGTNPAATYGVSTSGCASGVTINLGSLPFVTTGLATLAGGTATTTMLATGISDGLAPVTITTGTTATLGGTYKSGYTFNQEATAATAVTYTLPTAAAGRQYCVSNSNNGSAANTGVLTIQTSAAGQSIIYAGTAGASDGYLASAGAAGDAACVVGISATQWQAYAQSGTWTVH